MKNEVIEKIQEVPFNFCGGEGEPETMITIEAFFRVL